MQILPDSRVHRGEIAFRHGFRLGSLPLMGEDNPDAFSLALDVLDPVGRLIGVPGKNGREIIFDDPTVAVMLTRHIEETEDSPARRRPVFLPQALLTELAQDADSIAAQVETSLVEGGAEPASAARVAHSVASALQGRAFRPDHFGVLNWSPHLVMPFGLVLSGPWIGVPQAGEPIPSPAVEQ